MKFTELNLPENIQKKLDRMGFVEMTPIQEATYPIISSGRDLCALAETGSGKTAACAIPLIQVVDRSLNAIQGLVIVPTRELCIQYVQEIDNISKSTRVSPFAVYGGFEKEIQKAKLKHGVHILIATPGRLIDLLYEGVVDLSHIKCAILDEADELLKEGFLEDIELIMSCILHEHQTLLFAATMAPDIQKLADNCLHNPEHISLIKKRSAPKSLEHVFAYVHPKDKQRELKRYLSRNEAKQVIIFCNARHLVDKLYRNLHKEYDHMEYIHGGLSQEKRSSIFWRFRQNKIRYMIATDVAGRGLDFSQVSHVINWDFPGPGEQYTHRTGRAGRMGRKGTAFSFVTKRDLPQLGGLFRRKKITPQWYGKEPDREVLQTPKKRSQGNRKPKPPSYGRRGGKSQPGPRL